MDITLAEGMIAVIKSERERRIALLDAMDPDVAYDERLFVVEPFINELCLILLVAIRHQVERELLGVMARKSADGKPIARRDYLDRLRQERKLLRPGAKEKKRGMKRVIKELNLTRYPEWKGSMETLRLLANCYKHDPLGGPDEELLDHVNPQPRRNYDSLPNSECFREDLAQSLGLDPDTDYCGIIEFLLTEAKRFLANVGRQPGIATVKPGRVSLRVKDFVC